MNLVLAYIDERCNKLLAHSFAYNGVKTALAGGLAAAPTSNCVTPNQFKKLSPCRARALSRAEMYGAGSALRRQNLSAGHGSPALHDFTKIF